MITNPQEWTPWHEAQGSYIPQSVCDKHNAELAVERLNAKALADALEELVHQLPNDERLADFDLDKAESALAKVKERE